MNIEIRSKKYHASGVKDNSQGKEPPSVPSSSLNSWNAPYPTPLDVIFNIVGRSKRSIK